MGLKIGVILCYSDPQWDAALENICKTSFIRDDEDEIRMYRAMDGDLPTVDNTGDLHVMFCLGSPKSVNDPEPWMEQLSEFFRTVAELKSMKIVGICFGHQLINAAFGGTVTKVKDEKFIFGGEEISIDIPDDLADSRLGEALGGVKSLRMLQSHGDEVVTIGHGARPLGSSDTCKYEMVLVRENILTTQFHPDLTPQLMMEVIWPRITERGLVKEEDRGRTEESMEKLDTERFLDIVRKFVEG